MCCCCCSIVGEATYMTSKNTPNCDYVRQFNARMLTVIFFSYTGTAFVSALLCLTEVELHSVAVLWTVSRPEKQAFHLREFTDVMLIHLFIDL